MNAQEARELARNSIKDEMNKIIIAIRTAAKEGAHSVQLDISDAAKVALKADGYQVSEKFKGVNTISW